jgi:dipeptidyl aminopeptidase/acylaminoacyl peptidase
MRKAVWILLAVWLWAGCSTGPAFVLQEFQDLPAGPAVQFFYPTRGGTVEAYLVRPRGQGPFPLLVLLHGVSWVGVGASRMAPIAEQFAVDLCYAGLAISLPGYGSTAVDGHGDRDAFRALILDGVAKATELSWVDSKRILLYGYSLGAVFGAASVSKMPHLRAAALHSGAYDLPLLYQETQTEWVKRFLNRSLKPDGGEQPRLFSILPEVANWTAPTLILHGTDDTVIPVNQAELLNERLEAVKLPHRFVVFPGVGHRLPVDGVRDEILSFFRQHVGSACAKSSGS